MQRHLYKYLKFLPLHLGLWVVVWLFYIYFFSYASDNSRFVLWFSTSLLPVTMATTYVISYYIIPKFLVSKKYKLFAPYIGYTVVCSLFLIVIVTFLNFIFQSDFDIRNMPLLTRNFVFIFILVYLVVGIVSFVRLLRYQYPTRINSLKTNSWKGNYCSAKRNSNISNSKFNRISCSIPWIHFMDLRFASRKKLQNWFLSCHNLWIICSIKWTSPMLLYLKK